MTVVFTFLNYEGNKISNKQKRGNFCLQEMQIKRASYRATVNQVVKKVCLDGVGHLPRFMITKMHPNVVCQDATLKQEL